jgi:hypothetical protein
MLDYHNQARNTHKIGIDAFEATVALPACPPGCWTSSRCTSAGKVSRKRAQAVSVTPHVAIGRLLHDLGLS